MYVDRSKSTSVHKEQQSGKFGDDRDVFNVGMIVFDPEEIRSSSFDQSAEV